MSIKIFLNRNQILMVFLDRVLSKHVKRGFDPKTLVPHLWLNLPLKKRNNLEQFFRQSKIRENKTSI